MWRGRGDEGGCRAPRQRGATPLHEHCLLHLLHLIVAAAAKCASPDSTARPLPSRSATCRELGQPARERRAEDAGAPGRGEPNPRGAATPACGHHPHRRARAARVEHRHPARQGGGQGAAMGGPGGAGLQRCCAGDAPEVECSCPTHRQAPCQPLPPPTPLLCPQSTSSKQQSVADLVLTGHTDNAEFALGVSDAAPLAASGGRDAQVGGGRQLLRRVLPSPSIAKLHRAAHSASHAQDRR